MESLIRMLLPSIRISTPGWKIKRWLRSFWRSVIELLAIVGLAALIAAVWYLAMFVF